MIGATGSPPPVSPRDGQPPDVRPLFVALQATADGLGYGLGPLPVLSGDLATGRLVTLFPGIVVPRPGYVALVPNDADKTSTLAAFVDWLMAEGAP